jgi:methylmalonyl-CoA epimerase
MRIEKIQHIGIAAANLDQTVQFFTENLGGELLHKKLVPDQKLISAMVKLGDGCLEIMESTEADGVVSKFIAKRGDGVHHIALRVNGILKLIQTLEEKNVRVIGKQLDSPEVKVAFIDPRSAYGVLIELVEFGIEQPK